MKKYCGRRIHFIGIGGISMSALARFCIEEGAIVTGSDARESTLTSELKKRGAHIHIGVEPKSVDGADIVVFSSAIGDDNAELMAARRQGIRALERYAFLGEVAAYFGTVVAVAGTHGKTTVTAMIAHILKQLSVSFLAHIGGEATGLGNYVSTAGERDIFVTEACEYKRSLLALFPSVGIVTNIECDHPDCYATIESIREVFSEFLSQCDNTLVSLDTFETLHMVSSARPDICKYAVSSSPDSLSDEIFGVVSNAHIYTCGYALISGANDGFLQKATLFVDGARKCEIVTELKGCYNLQNALFAIAAVDSLGLQVDICEICKALSSFKGVSRRFEHVGDMDGAKIVFDYAHHPTEIKCALGVAYGYGRVLAVFQPHTYSRTAKYLDSFISAFEGVDDIVLMPTYAARERESDGISAERLYCEIKSKYPEKRVLYCKNASSTVDTVKNLAKNFDVAIFLGAGDIYDLRKFF